MFSENGMRAAFVTGQFCNKGTANEVQTPHEGQNPRKRMDELVAVHTGRGRPRSAPVLSVLEGP